MKFRSWVRTGRPIPTEKCRRCSPGYGTQQFLSLCLARFVNGFPFNSLSSASVVRGRCHSHANPPEFDEHCAFALPTGTWVSEGLIAGRPLAHVLAMTARVSAASVHHAGIRKQQVRRNRSFMAIDVDVEQLAWPQEETDSTGAREPFFQFAQAEAELLPAVKNWVIFPGWDGNNIIPALDVRAGGLKNGGKALLGFHFYSRFSFSLDSVQHPFQFQYFEAELPRRDRTVPHEPSAVSGQLWRISKFERHSMFTAGHPDDGVARAKQEGNQVEVVAAEGRLLFFFIFLHVGTLEESHRALNCFRPNHHGSRGDETELTSYLRGGAEKNANRRSI
jgi:hypothetical protein